MAAKKRRLRCCCCRSHTNSHGQVRGHRVGFSRSGVEEYPRKYLDVGEISSQKTPFFVECAPLVIAKKIVSDFHRRGCGVYYLACLLYHTAVAGVVVLLRRTAVYDAKKNKNFKKSASVCGVFLCFLFLLLSLIPSMTCTTAVYFAVFLSPFLPP